MRGDPALYCWWCLPRTRLFGESLQADETRTRQFSPPSFEQIITHPILFSLVNDLMAELEEHAVQPNERGGMKSLMKKVIVDVDRKSQTGRHDDQQRLTTMASGPAHRATRLSGARRPHHLRPPGGLECRWHLPRPPRVVPGHAAASAPLLRGARTLDAGGGHAPRRTGRRFLSPSFPSLPAGRPVSLPLSAAVFPLGATRFQ